MSKSLYKLPYLNNEVLLKSLKLKKKKEKTIIFHQRNSLIPFVFIKKVLEIHQGLRFKNYNFGKIQLGFRLGEFTVTRRKPKHTSKRIKLKKKRKINMNFKSAKLGTVKQLKKKGFFI